MTDGGPFYLGPPRFLRNKNNTSAEDDDIDMDMDHEGSHSSGSRGKGKAKRKLRVRSTSERLRRERRKAKAPVSRPSKEERERDVIGVLEGKYKSRIRMSLIHQEANASDDRCEPEGGRQDRSVLAKVRTVLVPYGTISSLILTATLGWSRSLSPDIIFACTRKWILITVETQSN